MAVNPTGTSNNPATGTGQEPNSPEQSQKQFDVAAAFEGLQRQMASLTSGYQGLRSLNDRRYQELRDAVGRVASGEEAAFAPEPRTATQVVRENRAYDDEDFEDIRRDAKIGRFLQDNPGARDHWQDIMKVIQSDNTVGLVTAYDAKGRIDYYRSYRNAFNQVLADKYAAAQAHAANGLAAANKANGEVRAQAVGSGVAAEPDNSDEDIDLNALTAMSDEARVKYMEDHGLTKLFGMGT